MKIGIIVAMEKELNALQRVFGDDPRYVIKQCGIGKVNAAIGAAEMIREHHPDAIVSSGCAGGNGADLRVQDVVVSTELAYHDVYCGEAVDGSCVYGQVQGMPARFQADPDMLAVAKKLSTLNSKLSTMNMSYIHPNARIAEDVKIEAFAWIGEDVEIGSGTWIGPNATIMDGARIGKTARFSQVP